MIDKFGASTVKRVAVYGEGAVDLLNKVPTTKLINDIHVVLKRTGKASYEILKQVLNVAEWLLPVIFGLLSIVLGLIKKGVILGAQVTKSMVNEQNVLEPVSEQKSSPQENT